MDQDQYNLIDTGKRLQRYLDLVGVKLLTMAAEARDTTITSGEKLLSGVEKLVTTNYDAIRKDLITLREYVRSYHDLQKDYHFPNYMRFDMFTLTKKVTRTYEESDSIDYDSDGNSVSRDFDTDNTYQDIDTYFTDTVKNVLHMTPELREGVRTLFVGDNYDIKINLVKDLVSPDTLMIRARMLKNILIPFLPSVHRISILTYGKKPHPILLNNYLETITELRVECRESDMDKHLFSFIKSAPNLVSLHISTHQNVHAALASALLDRRGHDLCTIKSFRLSGRDASPFKDTLELLNELQYLPLEVLQLCIYDSDSLRVTNKLVELLSKNDSITTLLLRFDTHIVEVVLPILQSVLKNVKILDINGSGVSENEDYSRENAILSMPEVRYAVIDLSYDLSTDVKEHINRNRLKDAPMIKVVSLRDKIPIVATEKYAYEKCIGVELLKPKVGKIKDILYSRKCREIDWYDSDDEYGINEEERSEIIAIMNPTTKPVRIRTAKTVGSIRR